MVNEEAASARPEQDETVATAGQTDAQAQPEAAQQQAELEAPPFPRWKPKLPS